jgi:hypothetical protein
VTRTSRADLAWSALLGVVVLGPLLLGRGFALQGDMVFVPDQPWKGAWLGLDGAAGRFVPGDAVVSLLTQVIPGDLLQKALLLGALVLGGVGAGRMVATRPAVARAAGITLYLWNPWVYERLAIGQWGVVVGYLLLPWVVLSARAYREDPRAAWPGLTVALGVSAVCSPPAALVAVLTAVCVAAGPVSRSSARRLGALLGVAVVVNLPWIVPSLLSPVGTATAPGQFGAFAARGESGLGAWGSVASLGGVWKSSIVPPERESVAVVAIAGLLTLVAVAGLWRARDLDARTRRGLVVLALVSLAVAALPALSPVQDALDGAAGRVPPLGLVRDSHRFLGPAALALLLGFSTAVGWVWESARPGLESLRFVAVAMVLWPVVCLPSLAWGERGAFAPVDYPAEWAAVGARLGPRPTVVLPWTGGYRGFAWNDRTAVLDPAPRYFPGEVLIDDRIILGSQVIASEDPLLADIAEALESADPAGALTALGIGQVLLEKDNGVPVGDMPRGRVVHDGPLLRLVALDGDGGYERPGPPVAAVVAADLLALAGVVTALIVGLVTRRRRGVYVDHEHTNPGEGL